MLRTREITDDLTNRNSTMRKRIGKVCVCVCVCVCEEGGGGGDTKLEEHSPWDAWQKRKPGLFVPRLDLSTSRHIFSREP